VSVKTTIAAWHAYMQSPTIEALSAMLANDCVFYSPVVHTPQRGKAMTTAYLWSAAQVFSPDSGFTYAQEIIGAYSVMLEFNATVDGIAINGVDIIHVNAAGLIDEFKVMVRPMKGMQMLQAKMAERLEVLKVS
jgi:SnoaL-like domain